MDPDIRPHLRLLSKNNRQVCVRHPETRAAQYLSLDEFVFRLETSLEATILPEWLPLITAMADAMYMTSKCILTRASLADEGLGLSYLQAMCAAGIVEKKTVEAIYHAKEWPELERPRTWELNGWWAQLYGIIPMPPSVEDEDEEACDLEVDAIEVGVRHHPSGLQSEDNQVRLLLERGFLLQTDCLYRLKVSFVEQERALASLRAGWLIDKDGGLMLPKVGSINTHKAEWMGKKLGSLAQKKREFDVVALSQLVRLGLIWKQGGAYSGKA